MNLKDKARIVELAEAECLADGFAAAPAVVAKDLGMSVERIGGGVATIMRNDPTGGFWSRVIGLGVEQPITDDVVEEVIDLYSRHAMPTTLLQIGPAAEPEDWEDIVTRHGFTAGGGWVKMLRDASPPPPVDTDLRIRTLGASDATDYGSVYWEGFGFPDPRFKAWMTGGVGRRGWVHFGAYDGDTIVAVAATFHWQGIACLYGAATLPSHRNRGGQSALMAARLIEAAAHGDRWVSTETGTETDEDPNPSLHNMRRMGFKEVYVRRNWIRRPQAV
jgi:GNAT superfamily N-acetyltransferase